MPIAPQAGREAPTATLLTLTCTCLEQTWIYGPFFYLNSLVLNAQLHYSPWYLAQFNIIGLSIHFLYNGICSISLAVWRSLAWKTLKTPAIINDCYTKLIIIFSPVHLDVCLLCSARDRTAHWVRMAADMNVWWPWVLKRMQTQKHAVSSENLCQFDGTCIHYKICKQMCCKCSSIT